jgi:hypothetical protein
VGVAVEQPADSGRPVALDTSQGDARRQRALRLTNDRL